MEFKVRFKTDKDSDWIDNLVRKEWDDDFIVTGGKTYKPKDLQGIIIEEKNNKVGLLTYVINNKICMIVSLNSLRPKQGVGSLLIKKLKEIAEENRCLKIYLETTNSNINALGFYQKKGFKITAVYPNAINEARKIKPSIPLVDNNGIPIRDAIVLELSLSGSA